MREENKCFVCGEAITNPMCSTCLTESIKVWLNEVKPSLVDDILPAGDDGSVKCLFCNGGMSVCAHCFSYDIAGYLSSIDKKLAYEFASRFDFGVRKRMAD